mmetsp:Transcript_39334/g.70462  ORF Transcript_39334/g.70462 Transcript_39334/m.70462 type:complete len:253 (-) Transcript_39334:1603-2361(-)
MPFSICERSATVRPLRTITLHATSAPSHTPCHTLAKEPEPRHRLSSRCPMSTGLESTVVSSMRSFCCSLSLISVLASDLGRVVPDAAMLEPVLLCRVIFLDNLPCFKREGEPTVITLLAESLRAFRRRMNAHVRRPTATTTTNTATKMTTISVTPSSLKLPASGPTGTPTGGVSVGICVSLPEGLHASTLQRDQRPWTKQPTYSSCPKGFRHSLPKILPYSAGYDRLQGSQSSPFRATDTLPAYMAPLSSRF